MTWSTSFACVKLQCHVPRRSASSPLRILRRVLQWQRPDLQDEALKRRCNTRPTPKRKWRTASNGIFGRRSPMRRSRQSRGKWLVPWSGCLWRLKLCRCLISCPAPRICSTEFVPGSHTLRVGSNTPGGDATESWPNSGAVRPHMLANNARFGVSPTKYGWMSAKPELPSARIVIAQCLGATAVRRRPSPTPTRS